MVAYVRCAFDMAVMGHQKCECLRMQANFIRQHHSREHAHAKIIMNGPCRFAFDNRRPLRGKEGWEEWGKLLLLT